MSAISKQEYLRRIYTICGWIIEGVQSSLIIRQIIENRWTNALKEKDQQRSAERMLAAARKIWTEIPEGDLKERRRIKVAQLQQHIRSLKETYKGTPAGITAIMAVEKEIIKLEGLAMPLKISPTDPDGNELKTQTFIIGGQKIEFT